MVFKDKKVVFVRHEGILVSVSPNRLHQVNSYLMDDDKMWRRTRCARQIYREGGLN